MSASFGELKKKLWSESHNYAATIHSSGVMSHLDVLHAWHAVARFSISLPPPLEIGITWSQCNGEPPPLDPQ